MVALRFRKILQDLLFLLWKISKACTFFCYFYQGIFFIIQLDWVDSPRFQLQDVCFSNNNRNNVSAAYIRSTVVGIN